LVGVGLLGGSLGLALKERRIVDEVVGFVRRPASVRECQQCGAVDRATLDLHDAVRGADVVVLCTPISRMRELTGQMLPALKPGAIVTDVGSVKGSVVRELEPLIAKAKAHFVGSHPMAGGEKMGVSAARPDLFVNAVCVVTPGSKSNRAAVRKVTQLWRAVGARLLTLAPDLHDELVSRSSHLPHVVAAALASFVLDPAHPKQQQAVCANGFRDATRIASGSPEMWRDIAVSNRRHLARAVDAFIADLRKVRRALGGPDAGALAAFFEAGKQRRDRWRSPLASPSSE
jgi:prephenate dehydrogenase